MSWLIAAYAAVVAAVGCYYLRLARIRRFLESELGTSGASRRESTTVQD
jgi:CcmD family protein